MNEFEPEVPAATPPAVAPPPPAPAPDPSPVAPAGGLAGAAAYVAATHAREAEIASSASYPPDPVPVPAAPPPAPPRQPEYLSPEQLARVPAHARDHEEPAPEPLRQAIIDAMRSVYDPEIPVNIYDIGLIYDVTIDAAKCVKITMTLTSPTCPAAESLPPEVQAKVAGVDGVDQVDIDLVWEPGWTPVMMSEDARLILNVM